MKKTLTSLFPFGVAAALLVAAVPNVAHAQFPLRATQVTFNSGSLQNYLNLNNPGPPPIIVNTDQLDAQQWTSSVSGNSDFTLMIELSGNAQANSIGIYNVGQPPLFQVFPGAATAGWSALAHFAGGNLTVTLFDNNGVPQGQTFYPGVNKDDFGFYLQGPGGTFFSEDSRNGGSPQVLTYAGTGVNFGDWWVCFEDAPYAAPISDFDDAVLLCQSIVPTATSNTTWGSVKSRFH